MSSRTEPADQVERDRIIQRTDQTLFVSAGAGSGKTKSLVDRVAQLVLEDGVAMTAIATVTFTNKAGAELRDRLRERFEEAVRTAADPARRDQAQAALDDLDLAAIGTLHSFAQRILTAHPIEAELPPAIDVLDEVASSIAYEERWTKIQQELLDDDDISEALTLGMAVGVTLRHVRELVKLLGQDWDRIDSHILAHPPDPIGLPDLAPVMNGLAALAALRGRCTNTADRLFTYVVTLEEHLARLAEAASIAEVLEAIPTVEGVKLGNSGAKGNWSGENPKDVRDEIKEVIAAATAIKDDINGQCIRHLTHWAARRVLDEAEERQRSGRLEFHDLLVLSRNLLINSPTTRAILHDRYERLLLDEFQDTDPIQIELAVRIAGGAEATERDWRRVTVPEGRLFVVGDAKQSIYRFRRASIKTYLDAQDHIGADATLTANFRTLPPILDWVNAVFAELIQYDEGAQPAYEPLVAHRVVGPELMGAPVTILGAEAHTDSSLNAAELRTLEAADVAGIAAEILKDGEKWTVYDESAQEWRGARASDVAILIPSRTSMPMLEEALNGAGLHFRAEAMSLVYAANEIRDLLATARAVADTSDQLALVTALRSPLFGCGDDELWEWRRHRGRFDIFAKPPTEDLAAGPVGEGIAYLGRLHRAARWITPSEVLARIVAERRLLELGAYLPRTNDSWRRVRFVVDQARAWTEVSHGGLRAYLSWVAHQAQERTRVSEAILPEQDVNAVRVMTVHAAKGLEFPIVVLSGMTTQPQRQPGVRLLWDDQSSDYSVSLKSGLKDPSFEGLAAIDEQMGEQERRRLLYVATTRARDHLVVSLHRVEDKTTATPAVIIEGVGGAEKGAPYRFELDPSTASPLPAPERAEPPPEYQTWLGGVLRAREASRQKRAVTASGLEGTEPEVVLGEAEEGAAKGPRDLDLPPWSKGRYGSAVGRAVHGVLQVVDLSTGQGLQNAIRAQVLAEGLAEHEETVNKLVQSALASDIVRRAASREHWREAYVGAPLDGQLVEGIIDLLYREDDGALVVVDYKTDVVSAPTLDAKVAFYRPQLDAYRRMLIATTGAEVTTRLLFLHPGGSLLEAL